MPALFAQASNSVDEEPAHRAVELAVTTLTGWQSQARFRLQVKSDYKQERFQVGSRDAEFTHNSYLTMRSSDALPREHFGRDLLILDTRSTDTGLVCSSC